MASYDIEGARKAGYSDADIAKDISAFNNIDYNAAVKGGHTNKSIIESLSVNKNKEAGANAPGAARGLISVMQGPTLGFADELGGAIGGAYDTLVKGGNFGENYAANRDYLRGAAEYEQKENPYISGITQTMASAPLSVLRVIGAAPKVANAMSKAPELNMLGQGLTAAGTGALYGAAGGAGSSTADTLGGVGVDALMGGALSSVLGGASVPVARGVGALGSNMMQRFNPASATTAAQLEAAKALARDAEAQQIKGNPVIGARNTLLNLGDSAVLADVGGASTRGLLDTIATLPGSTKEAVSRFIRQREHVGAAPRMIARAEEAMGVQGQRLAPTLDALTAKQVADAAPLYDQLKNVSVRADEELVKLLAREPAAHKAAEVSSRRRGELNIDLSLIKEGDDVPLAALDKIKKTLWDMSESAKLGESRKPTTESRDLDSIRVSLIDKLDRLSPKDQAGNSIYKLARDAFAGPAELKDAANIGSKSLAQTEARISDQIKNFSQSEMDAFRVGAFESLRQKLGTSLGGRTEIINAYKNPVVKEKLQAIFGNEQSYQQFARKMAIEERFRLLNSTDKGSQTASRLAAADDLGLGALKDVAGIAAGVAGSSPMGMGQSIVNLLNRTKMPETTRNELGRILLSGNLEGQNNLRSMTRAGEQVAKQRQQAAQRAGLFAVTPVGSAMGSAAYQMLPGVE